jgi:hypothetical protein
MVVLIRLVALMIALFAGFAGKVIQGQDNLDEINDDQAMVQGLRDRGLLELADRLCDQSLTKKDVSGIHHANLVVEKIRTQMARAIQTPVSERAKAWEQAQTIGNEFFQKATAEPRRPIVEIQLALARLAEGRLIAAENRIGSVAESLRQRGLEQLREARKRLDGIERELKKQLGRAPTQKTSDGRLTNEQVHSILANVRFQMALASLETANYYPADDRVNRVDVLTGVVSGLEEILGQVDAQNALAHAARIRLAEAQRLMANFPAAEKNLALVPVAELNGENRQLFLEQSFDLAVDAGRPATAVGLLETIENSSTLKPSTQLAMLRLMFAMSKQVPAEQRSGWLDRATNLIARIDATQGTYWSRLAERTLLANSGSTSAATIGAGNDPAMNQGTVELVARVGEAALRESRWADAREAFDQAATEAQSSKNWSSAFEYRFKSAQASEKLKEFSIAAAGLLELVTAQPKHEFASTAHLRAIWSVSQMAAADAKQKERFRELLGEHLRDWPTSESSNQARLWLARLLFAENRIDEAVESYLQISTASPHSLPAARDLRSALPRLIQELKTKQKSPASEAARISKTIFAQFVMQPDGSFQPTERDCQRLLALAPLVAEFQTIEHAKFAQLLEAALQSSEARQADWYRPLLAATVAFLSGDENKQGRAKELFTEIEREPSALVLLFDLQNKLAVGKTAATYESWLVKTSEALEATATAVEERTNWQVERAKVLFANRRFEPAKALLGPLAKASPNRGDIQLLYARSLAELPEQRSAALDQWRRVSAKLKDQSEEWFESKYQVARLLLELGQKGKAAELLRFLNAIPPGWSKSTWNSKFDELFAKCKDE